MPGGVGQQRAPAAADIEQPFAFTQRELAADQVELAVLRSLERLARAGEVRARIDHRRPQHQPVEAVRDVVVMTHRVAIACQRPPPPTKSRLDRRHPRRTEPSDADRPCRREREPDTVAPRYPYAGERVADAQHRLEIALDVERAVDPRACQPELSRGAQQVHNGRRIADDDRRSVIGGQLAPVPEANRHRQRRQSPVRHLAKHVRNDRCDTAYRRPAGLRADMLTTARKTPSGGLSRRAAMR